MDFQKKLQGRSSQSPSPSPSPSPSSPSSSYIPPHRTQLHPRMISLYSSSSNPNPNSKSRSKSLLIILLFLSLFFTTPFLYYLFSTALKIHSAPNFSSPNPTFFALLLHLSPTSSRISLFHFLGHGTLPFLSSTESSTVRGGFDGFDSDRNAIRGNIEELVEFAKGKVPRKEWGSTRVQLMVSEELEGLEIKEKVLEGCREVLRFSGFLFKDQWARLITGDEQGISSWVAVNYALGNLGHEPQETTGIVELGVYTSQGQRVIPTGVKLKPEEQFELGVPDYWSGIIWARTGCNGNPKKKFHCTTGDCGTNNIHCHYSQPHPPTTLVKFDFVPNGKGSSMYKVDIENGYNIPVTLTPLDSRCMKIMCSMDWKNECPDWLGVYSNDGRKIACKSPCFTTGAPKDCCTGAFATPQMCGNQYTDLADKYCPSAVSTPLDETHFTCFPGLSYLVQFC